jgi:hypothetical protein
MTASRVLLASDCYLLHAGFFLGSFVDREEGGDLFLPKVGRIAKDNMTFHLKGQKFS